MLTPYSRGKHDCWWLVTKWYNDVLGITLNERDGARSVKQGFEASCDWASVDTPEDHDVVLMSRRMGRRLVTPGHAGIFIDGLILHTINNIGPRIEKIEAEHLVHSFQRHLSRIA